jgi:hypothetical protein
MLSVKMDIHVAVETANVTDLVQNVRSQKNLPLPTKPLKYD